VSWSQEYNDGRSQFKMTREGGFLTAVFTGEATLAGNAAFTGWVDSQIAAAQPEKLRVLLDIRGLQSVGFRVKLAMAKWILTARNHLARVAVVGDDPAARALAGAINGVQFFETVTEAQAWLNFVGGASST